MAWNKDYPWSESHPELVRELYDIAFPGLEAIEPNRDLATQATHGDDLVFFSGKEVRVERKADRSDSEFVEDKLRKDQSAPNVMLEIVDGDRDGWALKVANGESRTDYILYIFPYLGFALMFPTTALARVLASNLETWLDATEDDPQRLGPWHRTYDTGKRVTTLAAPAAFLEKFVPGTKRIEFPAMEKTSKPV
jgi:hypothetical protein